MEDAAGASGPGSKGGGAGATAAGGGGPGRGGGGATGTAGLRNMQGQRAVAGREGQAAGRPVTELAEDSTG